jgi:hypothetical protein
MLLTLRELHVLIEARMSLSTPIQRERRRAPRYPFGGVAEVTVPESDRYLVAVTGEISRLGCFVKTTTPFAQKGEAVNLKITFNGEVFAATGSVVYVSPTQGIGIAFCTIQADNQTVLDHWLAQNTI